MITVNTRQAKTRLSALLAAVEESGETVVICRRGRPVAELRAVAAGPGNPDPLRIHPALKAQILYDPTEPAVDEEWPGECR